MILQQKQITTKFHVCTKHVQLPPVTNLRQRWQLHTARRATRLLATPVNGLQAPPWTGSRQQIQALQQLKERMGGELDEETLKWYLRDRYFDAGEAESKLRSFLRWRQQLRPHETTFDMIRHEYDSGKAYVHDHPDVHGRPVIVVRTRLHVIGQYPITDSKRLAAYLIDQAVSRAVAEGGEHILGIFDLKGFSMAANSDFVFAQFVIEALFNYYPRRVGQMLLVDAPWIFQPAWQAFKPLMRKYAGLVHFVSAKEVRQKFFAPGTAPPDFM